MTRRRDARSLLVALCAGAAVVLAGWQAAGVAAQQSSEPSAGERAYLEWFQTYQPRLVAAVQAVPTTLDIGNSGWRREQALALDSWGAILQEARDQRPAASAQALHSQLLDAVDHLDSARRELVGALAAAQEPGSEMTAELRQGRQGLADTTQRARALAQGRATTTTSTTSLRRGDLRVTVLAVTRPYLDRGAPQDPDWEYATVRLRLENVGGEPLRYDAFQFRLRSADDTLHNPVPLGVPDELLYGALEGNRLAAGVVGNIAYPVRKGVASLALLYEPAPFTSPLEIPLAEPGATSAATTAPAP